MDKASEAWRLQCEIRYVAGMPQIKRQNFYLDVKKHRGEAAANALIASVNQYRREAR